MEGSAAEHGGDAAAYGTRADRVRQSFNERFWNDRGRCLYDVIDTEQGGPGSVDAKIRPNQVLAIALEHPVLAEDRWEPVLQIVHDRLLTPVGLRSLVPGDPEYKPRYF